MVTNVRRLSRDQIARIVNNDPEAIRAFERLFRVATEVVPADISDLDVLVQLLQAESGTAMNKAETFQQNFSKLDYLDFNRIGPHVALPRRMQWNEDDGTIDCGLNSGVVLQVGQETHIYAKNVSGATIPNGTPVMWAGSVGASGKMEFSLAVADGSIPLYGMLGATTQDVGSNEFGYITTLGLIRGFRTDGVPQGETWVDGDPLYFSATTPGQWTNIAPQAPGMTQPVAIVIAASSSGSGSIFIRMEVSQNLSSQGAATRAVTGAATIIALSDYILLGDAVAGPVIVTMPSAASLHGRTLVFKKIDGTLNTVTIAAAAGETIDGASTLVINTQYESRTIVSDGTEWWII